MGTVSYYVSPPRQQSRFLLAFVASANQCIIFGLLIFTIGKATWSTRGSWVREEEEIPRKFGAM